MNPTNSPSSVPIGTALSSGRKWATPNGFGKASGVPPGAGSCTSRGRRTRPTAVRPASRKPAAATGAPALRRQLPGREEEDHEREEECHAGETDLGERAHLLRRRSAPGKVATPSTAYMEARPTMASPALSLSISQPIKCPARRTMSVPSVA